MTIIRSSNKVGVAAAATAAMQDENERSNSNQLQLAHQTLQSFNTRTSSVLDSNGADAPPTLGRQHTFKKTVRLWGRRESTRGQNRRNSVDVGLPKFLHAEPLDLENQLKLFSRAARHHLNTLTARESKDIRTRIFLILEEPSSSRAAFIFTVIMTSLILASTMTFVIGTVNAFSDEESKAVFEALEVFFNIAFTIEVILRLGCRGAATLKSSFNDVLTVVDIVSILPFWVGVLNWMMGNEGMELEALRLLRVLRLVKLARHYRGSELLISALTNSWRALLVPLFFLAVASVLFASVLYYVENAADPNAGFDSIPNSLWFMMVTFTTVGYGDRTPHTSVGMLVAIAGMLFGVIFMAMPLAIIGNNFSVVWEEKSKMEIVLLVQSVMLEKRWPPEKVVELFEKYDDSGDHSIDFLEFRSMLVDLGFGSELPSGKVRTLFATFDIDSSGFITFQEFSHVIFPDFEVEEFLRNRKALLMENLKRKMGSMSQEVLLAFLTADMNNDLRMDFPEFRDMLRKLGVCSPESPNNQLRVMFQMFDDDHDGTVGVLEFLEAILPQEQAEAMYASLQTNNSQTDPLIAVHTLVESEVEVLSTKQLPATNGPMGRLGLGPMGAGGTSGLSEEGTKGWARVRQEVNGWGAQSVRGFGFMEQRLMYRMNQLEADQRARSATLTTNYEQISERLEKIQQLIAAHDTTTA